MKLLFEGGLALALAAGLAGACSPDAVATSSQASTPALVAAPPEPTPSPKDPPARDPVAKACTPPACPVRSEITPGPPGPIIRNPEEDPEVKTRMDQKVTQPVDKQVTRSGSGIGG
ncbi:MAG: hypothetical protein ACK4RV_07035 [Caulobacter sp.]